jgi:Acyl-CoA carboxylase epsilon subunit
VADEIRIVRGTPTAEEVAALVGVLFGRRRPEPAAAPAPSLWRASGLPGTPPRAGRGAWRASSLPPVSLRS